jgi:hypothetical protein
MKTTVSNHDFIEAFRQYDRLDNFSFEALDLLFAYFEEYEESTGEEIELDVVSICCDFNESDADDIITNYSIDVEGMDDDEKIEAVRDYLQDNTTLVGETASGFVYAVF